MAEVFDMSRRLKCALVSVCASLLFVADVCSAVDGSARYILASEHATEGETDKILDRVRVAIARNRLTRIPEQCLVLEISQSTPKPKGMIEVRVRERHDERCGGDPTTSPHLFTV